MRKTLKRLFIALICAVCVLAHFSFVPFKENPYEVFADSTDFSSNEDYYYKLCSSTGLSTAQRITCEDFRDYLEKKEKDLKKEIANTQANISSLKADIANQGKKINEINKKISSVESQITKIEKTIKTIQTNIESINKQIEARQLRIEELDQGIRERMEMNQSRIAVNSWIQFIMGAKNFVDLFRRINAVNQFTAYDLELVGEMEEEKALLDNDKQELVEQKKNLSQQESSLKSYKTSLQSMKKQAQELIAAYQAKKSKLEDQYESKLSSLSDLTKAMSNIDKALASYSGSARWVLPLKVGFTVTSGCYYYTPTNPNSGFHAAVDMGARYGSSVYAVANGYVVDIYTGCPYGYLGSKCGSGRGNYVAYIVQVSGVAYLVVSQHLSAVNVKVGDVVTANSTVIGKVGSSGSSTGSHLHLGILKMGTMSLKNAVSSYKSKNAFYYGAKSNITYSCPYRGGAAPCFMNPMDIYKLKYRGSYN